MYHSTYKGVIIWRNTEPGYALRWTANVHGDKVASDTLHGIRQMITDTLGGNANA